MPHAHWLRPEITETGRGVLKTFEDHAVPLSASEVRTVEAARSLVAPALRSQGWLVATGGRRRDGVQIADVAGFVVRADATRRASSAALWLETGRSWTNNGFLEHVVEATMAADVDEVLIAVRVTYNGQAAYSRCETFLNALVTSGGLQLPYSSLLLIGF